MLVFRTRRTRLLIMNEHEAQLHTTGMRYKLMYALGGLVVGVTCMVLGSVLVLSGVAASTDWTFKLLGIAESNLTDAGPGVVLFVVGLFSIYATRYTVKFTRTSSSEEAGNSIKTEYLQPTLSRGKTAMEYRRTPGKQQVDFN